MIIVGQEINVKVHPGFFNPRAPAKGNARRLYFWNILTENKTVLAKDEDIIKT